MKNLFFLFITSFSLLFMVSCEKDNDLLDTQDSELFETQDTELTTPQDVGQEITSYGKGAEYFYGPDYMYFHKGETNKYIYAAKSSNGTSWYGHGALNNNPQTTNPPAAIRYGNKVFCFYRGNDYQLYTKVYYSYTFNGNTWWGDVSIPNTSIKNTSWQSPVPVIHNDVLYVFYDSGNTISYVTTTDGVSWSSPTVITTSTAFSPDAKFSVVVMSGILRLVGFNYAKDKIKIFSAYSGPTNSWSLSASISEATKNSGVTATVFNGQMYMSFRGKTSEKVYVRRWGASSSVHVGNGYSTETPHITTGNGKMIVLFKGNSSNSIWETYSTNGTSWVGNYTVSGTTKTSPWVIYTRQ